MSNWKIKHNTKTMNGGYFSFIIISNVEYKGIDILRRRHTNCHSFDEIEWWIDIINKNIPNNATLMNPYDEDQGWLSFNTLKECAKYIDENTL